MPEPRHADLPQPPSVEREQVLARKLSAGRQAMMAIGGAIGTGLFLASGLAVNVAGPAIILSYLLSAGLALLLTIALTEMAVAHPTAGSFGVYAHMYVSPFAGYAVRVSYWLMEVIATGGHLVAMSIYMQFWFPQVPGYMWTVVFGVLIVYLNARSIGTLGELEYWFVMIKIVAIVMFVVLGAALLFGLTGEPAIGLRNYVAHGGFLPMGWMGVWIGSCFTIYSFIGVEIPAVTSGEATDPRRTIPRAMLRMVLGLTVIYLVTIALLIGLMPWTQAGVGESPFVGVLRRIGIPGAASVMNFVVLSAALSAANANLYLITRSMFSLARGGFVPAAWGAVNSRGTPVNAVLISSLGLTLAVIVRALWPDSAYVWFFGVALFGGLFVYLMIFVTHLRFRRQMDHPVASRLPVRVSYSRATSSLGAVLILAMLITTWWAPGLDVTLRAAGPWMLLLGIGYWLSRGGQTDDRLQPVPSSSLE